ncbi:unnamed protein product [Fructobacillus tropaeoli]|uniref:SEC10/PgrA surface exclusion domain-containing protein n=1 Tax=Fructobacillus tropaeoli TaxID=709323 RepID=UPI002DADBA0D|nr:unnamed protein product [Fructobacillus tropaeoli]
MDDAAKASQDAQATSDTAKTNMQNAQAHAADLQKQADAGNHDMERASAQQAVNAQEGVVTNAQTAVQQAQTAVDEANAAYQAAQTGTTDSSKQATIAQQLNTLNNLKSQLASLKSGDLATQQQALQTAITNLTNLQNQLSNTPKQIASGSSTTSTSTGTPAQYNTAANQVGTTTGIAAASDHNKQIYISGTAIDFSKYASDPTGQDATTALYNAWNAAASDSDKITGDRMTDDQLREFNNYALQQIQKYREASGFDYSTLAPNQNALNAVNARSTDASVLDMHHEASSTTAHFANTPGAGNYASESLGQVSSFSDGSGRATTMAQAKVIFDYQLDGMINDDSDSHFGHRDMLLAYNSKLTYAAVQFYDPAKQVFNLFIDSSIGAQGNVNGTPSGTFTDDPTTPTMVDNPAYATLQNQVNAAQTAKDSAQSTLDATNNKVSDLQNQVNTAQSAYDASNAAGTTTVDQSKVASTKETLDTANANLAAAKTTLGTEQSKLTDLQNKLAAIPANTTLTADQQAELDNANKAMNDANAAYTAAYNAAAAATDAYNKLQAAAKADGQPVQVDNPAYAAAEQALATATQAHQDAVNKLADLQKQLADDSAVSANLQAQVADAQKTVAAGQDELVALKATLADAQKQLATDTDDLNHKKALLGQIAAIENTNNTQNTNVAVANGTNGAAVAVDTAATGNTAQATSISADVAPSTLSRVAKNGTALPATGVKATTSNGAIAVTLAASIATFFGVAYASKRRH